MKVLLKEDVDNLGYAGEVHNVAPGYGRNYLIPQGLAVLATDPVLRSARAWRERAAARRAQLRAEYEALSGRIEELRLVFEAKAGETGKLYGSVTTQDIVDRMNEALGTDLERRSIVSDPLRQVGEHQVLVRLSAEFQPRVTVEVQAEGGPADEAVAEAVAQAEAEATEAFGEPAAELEADEFEDEAFEDTAEA